MQLLNACHRCSEAAAGSHGLGHDGSSGAVTTSHRRHDQTVTAEYDVQEVLSKVVTSAMNRRRQKVSPSQVKLLPKMSEAIFQQDGAPTYHPASTKQWCRANFLGFWETVMSPGNSPELSPIENLLSIVQGELTKTELATSEQALFRNLRKAGLSMSAETQGNLMCETFNHMRECVRFSGEYTCK